MICFYNKRLILINTYISGEQKLIHYVAKETLIEDYIFSIAYYLTLQPDGNIPYIFPLYKDSVIDGDNKSNSRVDASFEVVWSTIYDITKEYTKDAEELGEIHDIMNSFYIDDISKKIGAHGAKKYAIQRLG